MSIKNVYEAAGYNQHKVGFGKSPAIIVIDFQEAFLNSQYKTGRSARIRIAAENTAELLNIARDKDVPVIYTVVAYRNSWDLGNWKTDLLWITPESEAAQVSPIVEPKPNEPIIVKKGPSAFFGTELATLLVTKQIDTVIITGCVTSGCIRASVIDSFSYGFKTIIPEECVGDHTEEQHKSNLFDVNARYADVISKKEVENFLQTIPNPNTIKTI